MTRDPLHAEQTMADHQNEASFPPGEIEAAFRRYWRVGAVEEDWAAWADCFTPDVRYIEHVYGELRGREAVRSWITGLMAHNPHIHAVLDWYVIDRDRVVLRMLNRYYNPAPGEAPLDFAGMTILHYAGQGMFSQEEDFWSLAEGKACYQRFNAARAIHGEGRLEETPARRRLRDPWA